MSKWQPIETAPKRIEFETDRHRYGAYILAYPVQWEVARVRWWETDIGGGGENFLDDGGNAAYPTHWMPLPDPPKESA